MKFQKIAKQLYTPFVAYADFECLLVQDEEKMKKVNTKTGIEGENINKEWPTVDEMYNEKNPERETREIFRKHIPLSYAYKIVGPDKEYDRNLVLYPTKISNPTMDTSKIDVAEHFLDSIINEAEDIYNKHIKTVKKMMEVRYPATKIVHFCLKHSHQRISVITTCLIILKKVE